MDVLALSSSFPTKDCVSTECELLVYNDREDALVVVAVEESKLMLFRFLSYVYSLVSREVISQKVVK